MELFFFGWNQIRVDLVSTQLQARTQNTAVGDVNQIPALM